MRPPLAGSHALTHGPCTDSFYFSKGSNLHVGRVGLDLGTGQGPGLESGSRWNPRRCSQIAKTSQPPVPAPFEPLDVSLQLFGQAVSYDL